MQRATFAEEHIKSKQQRDFADVSNSPFSHICEIFHWLNMKQINASVCNLIDLNVQ